jgi:hypothetical protein
MLSAMSNRSKAWMKPPAIAVITRARMVTPSAGRRMSGMSDA